MTKDENRLTRLFGKIYYWETERACGTVRLTLRPALDEDGNMKPETLRRLAGETA